LGYINEILCFGIEVGQLDSSVQTHYRSKPSALSRWRFVLVSQKDYLIPKTWNVL